MTDDQVIPLFEAVNLASKFKPEVYENKGMTVEDTKYFIHISAIFHHNIYWTTVLTQRPKFQPVIKTEPFMLEDKREMIGFINRTIGLFADKDWYFLWFSDGDIMEHTQFLELRSLWLKNLDKIQ